MRVKEFNQRTITPRERSAALLNPWAGVIACTSAGTRQEQRVHMTTVKVFSKGLHLKFRRT